MTNDYRLSKFCHNLRLSRLEDIVVEKLGILDYFLGIDQSKWREQIEDRFKFTWSSFAAEAIEGLLKERPL